MEYIHFLITLAIIVYAEIRHCSIGYVQCLIEVPMPKMLSTHPDADAFGVSGIS